MANLQVIKGKKCKNIDCTSKLIILQAPVEEEKTIFRQKNHETNGLSNDLKFVPQDSKEM